MDGIYGEGGISLKFRVIITYLSHWRSVHEAIIHNETMKTSRTVPGQIVISVFKTNLFARIVFIQLENRDMLVLMSILCEYVKKKTSEKMSAAVNRMILVDKFSDWHKDTISATFYYIILHSTTSYKLFEGELYAPSFETGTKFLQSKTTFFWGQNFF